jgi:hypothetical protein
MLGKLELVRFKEIVIISGIRFFLIPNFYFLVSPPKINYPHLSPSLRFCIWKNRLSVMINLDGQPNSIEEVSKAHF